MATRDLLKNNLTGFEFNSYLSEKPPFQGYSMDHTDLKRLKAGHVGGQVRQLEAFNQFLFYANVSFIK